MRDSVVVPFSQLELRRLRCLVRLGWREEERRAPQWVSFDIELRFPRLPEGCRTDRLEQTICYAELSEKIRGVCDEREFNLIEKLAYRAFVVLRETIAGDIQLRLSVSKENPPIQNLEGGACFRLGDWP